MVLFDVYSHKQKLQNNMSISINNHRRRIVIIALAAVVLVGASGGIYLFKNRAQSNDTPAERKPTINYAPASDTDRKENDDTKDRIINEQKQNPSTDPAPTQKKAVTPTITGTTGSIKAYVNGIFEEGGTCTATFTKDGTTLTKSSAGFQNVSYTQCAPISIGDGFLSPGTWSMTLSYSSATAEGTTASQQIEVN